MKTDKVRSSYLAPYINTFLEQKRAAGFLYGKEELILNRFDAYCVSHELNSTTIRKEDLIDWMKMSGTEGDHFHVCRISCIRQFLLFMAACVFAVYIPHDFGHVHRKVPHIFCEEEETAFFNAVDSYRPSPSRLNYVRLASEYRMIFRWYCCCGLRNEEAAGIKTNDVDLDEGVLTIMNAKGNKDRLVYLPKDLLESTRRYYQYLEDTLGGRPKWFFPAEDYDRHLRNTAIDRVFNRFWLETKFADCSNKPTVHSFRYTFVVRRMNQWVENGVDLKVMMPYLSRYLGHKSIDETMYYYWLVAEAFRTVEKQDTYSSQVIPEV